jgi:hypothetical protein
MRVKLVSVSGLLLMLFLAIMFARHVNRLERSGAVEIATAAYLASHPETRSSEISLCRLCSSRITDSAGRLDITFRLSIQRASGKERATANVVLRQGRAPLVEFQSGS